MRLHQYILISLVTVLLPCISGCRTALPVYPWEGIDAALVTMRSHEPLHSLTSECRLTLGNPSGKSVRLDGIMAALLPDHFRLQTWKFGRRAFDLTLTPNGSWISASRSMEREAPGEAPDFSAILQWLNIQTTIDQPHTIVQQDRRTATLRITQGLSKAEQTMAGTFVVIDKSTRTCRRIYRCGSDGQVTESVTLSSWTMIQDRPWPLRMKAQSPGGAIEAQFHDVIFNTDLPEQAFRPPPGATEIK